MAFKSRYPDLKLTLVDAGTGSIRTMLLNGELDIGVINLDKQVPDDLETDILLHSEMVAVVGKDHPFASKQSVRFDEFFEQDLVMFKEGYFHRDYIEAKAKENALELECAFETNLLPLILSIVRREFAITALLDLVTHHEADIVGVPFEQPVKLDLALAWRKGGYLSIADRTFIEFVKSFH
ncbi:Cys regulon transcriptional activator CysB [Vibrio ponticus]|nr:Cys regulon transcriptional activator CysB [Vibrio ponticus]